MQPCKFLDDYLDHDLPGADLTRFIDHLPGCALCRQVVADHEKLRALLQEASNQLELIPKDLVPEVKSRVRSARRRRFAAAAASLAATAAVIWLVIQRLPPPQSPKPAIAKIQRESPALPGSKVEDSVRVSFPHDAKMFFVREMSDSPNVTIVHVYSGLASPPHLSAQKTTPEIERGNE
jgi:hypothetical protein